LQWKALQECVVVHQKQLEQLGLLNNSGGDDSSNSRQSAVTLAIDAAPVIAIIDETTGVS
jgi:hypothetical protein